MKWIEGLGEPFNRTFSQNFRKRIKNEDSLFYAGILPLQSLLCYNLSSRNMGTETELTFKPVGKSFTFPDPQNSNEIDITRRIYTLEKELQKN